MIIKKGDIGEVEYYDEKLAYSIYYKKVYEFDWDLGNHLIGIGYTTNYPKDDESKKVYRTPLDAFKNSLLDIDCYYLRDFSVIKKCHCNVFQKNTKKLLASYYFDNKEELDKFVNKILDVLNDSSIENNEFVKL